MGLLTQAKMEQAAAKIAGYGPQGSGKTATMVQLAIGLSLTFHQGAPVAFFDTEKGSDFAKILFDIEGVKLLRVKSRAFSDLLKVVKEAEQAGCCALLTDSMSHVWNELNDSFCRRKKIQRMEFQHWRELKATWREWTDAMLNSRLHMLIAGRAGKEYEYQENEETHKKELITTGTKMRAEGEFGYEPDVLFELWTERVDGAKHGSNLIHKALVLKDRTWELNGQIFTWADRKKYKKDDWKLVYNDFAPYFACLDMKGPHQAIQADRTSDEMFDRNGDSEYYRNKKRRDVVMETLDATMGLLWPGQAAGDKRLRLLVGEKLFGVRSKTALEGQPLQRLEKGSLILQMYEQQVQGGSSPENEEGVLKLLDELTVLISKPESPKAEGAPAEKVPF